MVGDERGTDKYKAPIGKAVAKYQYGPNYPKTSSIDQQRKSRAGPSTSKKEGVQKKKDDEDDEFE